MKKSFYIMALACAIGFSCTSCCKNKPQVDESNYAYITEPERPMDEIYLDVFDSKAYNPNSKYTYSVTFDNPDLITYEDGKFVSTFKTGSTIAHFANEQANYDAKIYVTQSEGIPSFNVQYSNIEVNKSSSFDLSLNLTFRGRDVIGYMGDVHITKETDNGYANATYDATSKSIKIEGLDKGVGEDKFTVYTEFLGYTLSRPFTVSTRENKSLVVAGNKMLFDNVGPIYYLSTYQYSSNKLDLAQDLAISKEGNVVSYGDLSATISDTSIAELDGSIINVKKTGTTNLTLSYGGETANVRIKVTKPIIKDVDFDLTDKKFNLNLKTSVTDTTRSFSHDSEVIKDIVLPGDDEFVSLNEVIVNGTTYSVKNSDYTYDNSTRTLTLSSKIFDESCYGECPVTLVMDTAEYSARLNTTMLFVTRVITSPSDYINYIQINFAEDVIYGYYELGADQDRKGYGLGGSWRSISSTLGNANYGFRGVFDGCGHKIYDAVANEDGLLYKAGKGAVIRNLEIEAKFDMYAYDEAQKPDQYGRTILGKYIHGVKFENVKVTISNDSNTTHGTTILEEKFGRGIGLLCNQRIWDSCEFTNFELHAEGFDILRLFGTDFKNGDPIFTNFKVYAKSIKYYVGSLTTLSGVQLISE